MNLGDMIKAIFSKKQLTVEQKLGKYSDPVWLAKPCKHIYDDTVADAVANELLSAAKYLDKHHKSGCHGLAANQLGYPWRIFVVRHGKTFHAYVNPYFEGVDRKVQRVEHCHSHPGKEFVVQRYRKILASGNGRPREMVGIEAQAFQHEMDHINGVLV